jgi:hypothetical protein
MWVGVTVAARLRLGGFWSIWVLGVVMFPRAAGAQGAASPGPHFGFVAFPEMAPAQQIGAQVTLFTEYGKPGDGRYGDHDDLPTMGINLLTISNTRVLNRKDDVASNLLFTSTLQLGRTSDQPARFFQNQVRHRMIEADFVPRGRVRNEVEFGYGGQVVYRFNRDAWSNKGDLVRTPTPMFVLSGFNFGTLFSDGYVGLGIRDLIGPYFLYDRAKRWFYVSFSAMSRLGVPFRSCPVTEAIPGLSCGLDATAPYYMANQLSFSLHLFEAFYPLRAEVGFMGHTGLFVDKVRSPMAERFWTFRLYLGDFVFEIANDSGGHKDIGPTMATQVFYNVPIGTKFFGNLVNVL